MNRKCRSFTANFDYVTVRKHFSRVKRVTVTMRVFGGGERLAGDRAHPVVRKFQPNGPKCPPTCFHAGLEVGPDLKLHRAADDRSSLQCPSRTARDRSS